MYKMIVDFKTYFEDEMINCDDVDEILENYEWKKEVKCSCCGKVISIFDAMFNRECDLKAAVQKIYNQYTGKLITKLIARPGQVRRFYKADEIIPFALLDIARIHQCMAYNYK